MSEIVVDCTELHNNPVRSGIQRCVRELLRHWPEDGPELHPARVDPVRGLVRLPPAAVALLVENEPGIRGLPFEEIQQRLGGLRDHTGGPLPSAAPILIPEIFYDKDRCRFHEERLATHPGSLAMLSHDFLGYLQPSIFNFTSASPFMFYLRLLSMASSIAFNSEQTRREFVTRVVRVAADDPRIGPVVVLGADGLPVERQLWRRDRRQFVCIGSLDGRKNQNIVAAAFMRLWEGGHDSRLLIIGGKFNPALPLDWLEEARAFPQFSWLSTASDDDIAAAMREARATIFLSTAEGFGLPPVESLNTGIPVITLAGIPSVAMLPPLGQIRLSDLSVDAVADAVLALDDDNLAKRLWEEAATLNLGTWRTFAAQVARWCATL